MDYLVSQELLQKIFNYLVTKPCNETMPLVLEIQKLKPAEKPESNESN